MKNIWIILLLLLFVGASWFAGHGLKQQSNVVRSVQTASTLGTTSVQPTSIASRSISNPRTLEIPRLNIAAQIEHVGLDNQKRMDIPKEDMNVAWYMLGSKIGEKGSAVIAGHFDTKTGDPAVFFDINKLQKGDEIRVSGHDGKTLIFIVTETKTVKDANFPINEVFVRDDVARLNLITCAGTFNQNAKNYEDRFIVYSILKDA